MGGIRKDPSVVCESVENPGVCVDRLFAPTPGDGDRLAILDAINPCADRALASIGGRGIDHLDEGLIGRRPRQDGDLPRCNSRAYRSDQ